MPTKQFPIPQKKERDTYNFAKTYCSTPSALLSSAVSHQNLTPLKAAQAPLATASTIHCDLRLDVFGAIISSAGAVSGGVIVSYVGGGVDRSGVSIAAVVAAGDLGLVLGRWRNMVLDGCTSVYRSCYCI